MHYEVTENPEHVVSPIKPNQDVKWMLMPDGRDNLQLAIISGLQSNDEYPADLESVKFYLYTRENPKRAEIRKMNSSCLPIFKYFKNKRKTKILIHGFGDNARESFMVPILRDAFLSKGDFNIIAIDWSSLAAKPWYVTAVRNTRPVAKTVAKFIDHMCTNVGAKTKNFHIVGFSLGAHVAGLTANNVRTGKIKHVTGLDPAYVLYSSAGPDQRLDTTHAELVEVIHTSGGYIGYEKRIGHRDFYPNGGLWPQPGCVIDFAAVCSHRRAYYYYGEAILNNSSFVGVACDSYKQFVNNQCGSKKVTIDVESSTFDDKKDEGSYFLYTNTQPPFVI